MATLGIGVVVAVGWAAAPLTAQAPSAATRGAVHGKVVDAGTGAALPLVQVQLEGTALRAATDLNGRYAIAGAPVGTHRVQVRLIGYTPKTVTNVVIEGGKDLRLDLTLDPAAVALEAISVTAEVERGSALALIEDRRAAPTVTDAIGSEQISRSPDSDAAAALKRVTGMSVVGDRYVYVRGLGDRYSSASLNGAPLPSPEPDRKAVPLDLFPSSVLESVVTSKTYTPDQPGDYSGGLVDIRTKDFPDERTYKASVGVGVNSQTSFQDGLRYAGGDLDFLGIDDGTRDIPSTVPGDVKVINTLIGDQQLERIGRSFSSVWQPQDRTVPINRSASLSLGDRSRAFGIPFGALGAATYSDSYATQNLVERILVTADADELPETDYTGENTERTVRWSLFGKADVLLSPTTQLAVRSLYSRTADDVARMLSGFNRDRNNDLVNYRLRFTSRTLWTNTIGGDHYLEGMGGARVEWRVGYGRTTTDEPDRREVVYDSTTAGLEWRELTNSGTRYFTALEDQDVSGSVDLTIPLSGGPAGLRLKVGGLLLNKDRDFFTRRFRYRAKGALGNTASLPPDQLFSAPHIGPGLLELEEDTRRTDNYRGDQRTSAGYAMLDVPIVDNIRIVGGARLEHVRQTVLPYDLFPLGLAPLDRAVIDNNDLLPAVNATFTASPSVNLRAAFSRTVARPQFREQAPFDFVDFAGGFLQVGNPSLRRSSILNYDLRWEWFPRRGSLFAVSGFFKDFDDPIEVVVFPSSELIATWDNNDRAKVYGAELEARTSLDAIAPALANLSLSGNLTLVHSEVSSSDSLRLPDGNSVAIEPRERAMQGQSPYVVNAALTYFHPDRGTTVTALFNRFGRRIDKVGTQLLPDVFEESRSQFDVVFRQPFWRQASLRLAATNVLDASSTFTQLDRLVRSATRGRTVSVSFSFGAGG